MPRLQPHRALRHALTKPVVLAPVLGILLSLSGLSLGAVAAASLMLIGQAAAGMALFLTGLILSAQSFRLDWKVVGATGTADVIRPLQNPAAEMPAIAGVKLATAAAGIRYEGRTDVALIKVDARRDFPYVRLADKPPRIGDWYGQLVPSHAAGLFV